MKKALWIFVFSMFLFSIYSCENDIEAPKSSDKLQGLPAFSSRLQAKEWNVIQTSQETEDYNGEKIDKGTYVIARTDPAGKPMPAGIHIPSLCIGDLHEGNYTVSFDYCIPERGSLEFMIYDESDTVFANEYLGEEYFWYALLVNGKFDLRTTFGKNSRHLLDDDGKFISVANYDPTVWNHCTLNVTDEGTEVFINDELITVLEKLNDKKKGHMALDGIPGTMFKGFEFN